MWLDAYRNTRRQKPGGLVENLSDARFESKTVETQLANAPTEEPVLVLLVSPDDSDRESLAKALEGTRWQVLHAHSCAEALPMLESNRIPVIIREHDCCDLGCVHAVRCRQVGSYPAPVVVAAKASDFHLWEDVIDRGGSRSYQSHSRPPRYVKSSNSPTSIGWPGISEGVGTTSTFRSELERGREGTE